MLLVINPSKPEPVHIIGFCTHSQMWAGMYPNGRVFRVARKYLRGEKIWLH